MDKLGRSALPYLLKLSTFSKVPFRCRRANPRPIIQSFVNEEEYLKQMSQEKQDKKVSRNNKKNPDPGKSKVHNLVNDENSDIDWSVDVPKDILKLKFEKPNPAKIGSFSKMMLNMKSKSYRERHGSCMLEGKFLISDAMKSGMFVRLLYFSRLSNLVGLPIDMLQKTNLIKVGFNEIQQASEVKVQSEGLIAIATKQDEITRKKLVKWRNEFAQQNKQDILPLTLICDNIRDAGNMGALLRTAAAVGCEQVITTKGCVDIWDSKVIRAGAGAHFKLPIIPSLTWDEISDKMNEINVQNVYLTHPQAKTIKLSDIMSHFSAKNPFHQKMLSNFEESPHNLEDDGNFVKLHSDVTMHSLPYHDVTFVEGGHTVLVLGSEVSGTSPEAFMYSMETELKKESKSKKLYNIIYIPMSFGAECLNTAVAGSVLLFEAKRQMSD